MRGSAFLFVALAWLGGTAASAAEKPDVLMIVVDDMNDWVSLLDPDSPVPTPNLERLAARGMSFTRAYCASPACNPSRVATLTGLRPTTSGVYGNGSDWRGALPDRKTIFQQFRDAGYYVAGAGKIFHHHLDGAFHDDDSFDRFVPMRPQLYPDKKLNRAPGYGSRNTDWGAWPPREEDSIDHATVEAIELLLQEAPEDRPLFLSCGIFKPHSPFFAPASVHERLGEVNLPGRRDDDWEDLPSGARDLMEKKKWFWRGMMEVEKEFPGSYREFIRAYAACCLYADEQIGKVLDTLEATGRSENTIIVLWSDHGFHLGEKDHIEKFALWEKANRIPLLVVAPGITRPGSVCDRPVDLSALYPTLLALAGLPADSSCDGTSLVSLLENPSAVWELPALMTYGRGNHAVRSDRWRFIRYADGTEELYDHQVDPNEWKNLAGEGSYRAVLEEHRKWLPAEEAELVPNLKKR